jgi:hypothetical protein
MEQNGANPFAAKHGQVSPESLDATIREKLEKVAADAQLACAVAFRLADDLRRPPAEIGQAADLLGIRLVKCQLGLFGYAPKKKIVRPAEKVDRTLEDSIRAALQDGRLPCRLAWELAERFKLPKMSVSAACEALGIKVQPCQLGAF